MSSDLNKLNRWRGRAAVGGKDAPFDLCSYAIGTVGGSFRSSGAISCRWDEVIVARAAPRVITERHGQTDVNGLRRANYRHVQAPTPAGRHAFPQCNIWGHIHNQQNCRYLKFVLFYVLKIHRDDDFYSATLCQRTCPCGRAVNALGRHVQYSVTRSMAGVRLGPGASTYQRIISNDSYAQDERRVLVLLRKLVSM